MNPIEISSRGENAYYLDKDTLRSIRHHFSIENPNPKASVYSRRKYVMTPGGRFDVGLWGEISGVVKQNYPDREIILSESFQKTYNPVLEYSKILPVGDFEYYCYQEESIKHMFKNGRGVIILPTAAGKSLVIGGFTKTYLEEFPNSKVLVLVPNISLLQQIYKSFKDEFYFDDVTKWSGKNSPDLDASVRIVNFDIITKNMDRGFETVGDSDIIIVDECHKLLYGNKITEFISKHPAPNKFGLTGTLPNDDFNRWSILGKIGPVLYSKKSSELRDDLGTIADVEVQVLRLVHRSSPKKYSCAPGEPYDSLAQYNNEIEFLYESPWRTKFVSSIVNKLNGNVLILVDRLFQGEILQESILNSGDKETYFISGEMPVEDRADICEKMETQDNIACVAMDTIFSTGISVKNLKYIVFVCIGKSQVKVLQSIGRSLRLHDNKTKSIIFDISDWTKYSSDHLLERIEFYKQEEIKYEVRKIEEK